MAQSQLDNLINNQKDFFQSGKTKSIEFRISALKKISGMIEQHESEIITALFKDLHKSPTEAFTSEISYVQNEIKHTIKNLKKWNRPVKIYTPLINRPGKSFYKYEPFGIALIISPWNYPFGLLFSPLIGAIAAGNCVIAKPSEMASHSSELIHRLICDYFDANYIAVQEGDAEVTQSLINENIDHIFFTGSTAVGKEIMKSASNYLIPVTLELGGKNPCIVDQDINIDVTAKRILWGKFFNAGQTCIAPDFALVHEDIYDQFINKLNHFIDQFYSEDDFSHIINNNHFDRLSALIEEGEIIKGGILKPDDLYISPTIITDIDYNSKIMQEEIFGPVLPIIKYKNLDNELLKLAKLPKPLVQYFFSKDKSLQDMVINRSTSGSVCINGTIHILMSSGLPFGGVGASGMGRYHGKESFSTFSYKKSVVRKSFFADMKAVYPPYKTPIKILKKVIKFLY